MNYQKLDPALAMALTEPDEISDAEVPAFTVFISTTHDPEPDEISYLEALGVSGVTADQRIFTAILSADAVNDLSEQPWVQFLELSQELELLNWN